MRAEAAEPSIRGSYITTGKAWIIKIYGAELFEKALLSLPAEHQDMFRMELVGIAWYPIKQWTKVLDAVRALVREKTGEDAAVFDRRLMFESISRTMDGIFRIAFSLLSPITAVAKMTPYFQKVYSHGTYSVVENESGHCKLRISDAVPAMESEVMRAFPIATSWMLDVAGQSVTRLDIFPTSQGSTMSFDVVADYKPKPKKK